MIKQKKGRKKGKKVSSLSSLTTCGTELHCMWYQGTYQTMFITWSQTTREEIHKFKLFYSFLNSFLNFGGRTALQFFQHQCCFVSTTTTSTAIGRRCCGRCCCGRWWFARFCSNILDRKGRFGEKLVSCCSYWLVLFFLFFLLLLTICLNRLCNSLVVNTCWWKS